MPVRPSVENLGQAVSESKALTAFAFVVVVAAVAFALYQVAQAQKEIDDA